MLLTRGKLNYQKLMPQGLQEISPNPSGRGRIRPSICTPQDQPGGLREAQHHHRSAGSARPALEATALFTAAPKHYVSETAELTNLTFPK